MTNKEIQSTKSLFLYTALIFVVALLLILISFFGDSNLQKSIEQHSPTQIPVNTQLPNKISERAAELSAENVRLMGENKEITEENEQLKKQVDVYKKLFSAKAKKDEQNVDEALIILEGIDYESLDNEQKAMYNEIKG